MHSTKNLAMEILDDLILYGRENGCLDYKAKQYNKSKAIDLLKNIMAMANGAYEGDKFIIVGVRQEAGTGLCQLALMIHSLTHQHTSS